MTPAADQLEELREIIGVKKDGKFFGLVGDAREARDLEEIFFEGLSHVSASATLGKLLELSASAQWTLEDDHAEKLGEMIHWHSHLAEKLLCYTLAEMSERSRRAKGPHKGEGSVAGQCPRG